MSTQYSFNLFTGELQTSVSTFPIRLTFGQTQVSPLVSEFSLSSPAELGTKLYMQGGPGKSVYSPAMRKITGKFSLPMRISEDKELDPFAKLIIDYAFFAQGSSCTPLAIRYFELETGFFKTAQGFMVPPGKSNTAYNDEFIQIKINRCIISSLSISTQVDGDITISVEFTGTIRKTTSDELFSEESSITEINSSFPNYRIASLHDCKAIINGSYLPNCNEITFTISREIVEKNVSRSFNVDYSSILPGIAIGGSSVLNYSNDFPSKISVKSFEAKITLKQVLRKIDEDLYFSRSGKASIYSEFADHFILAYFGPVKIYRTCALAQQSEQPYGIGVIERSTTFLLLNKPKVIQEDFISVITGGGW